MQPPVQYVSQEEICRLFNEGRYFERLQDGEFVKGEIVSVGPSPSNFPIGSHSQMVEYLTHEGKTIAWIHQDGDDYGNPVEGSIPDPKFLFHQGVRYKPSEFPPSPPLRYTRKQSRGKPRKRR